MPCAPNLVRSYVITRAHGPSFCARAQSASAPELQQKIFTFARKRGTLLAIGSIVREVLCGRSGSVFRLRAVRFHAPWQEDRHSLHRFAVQSVGLTKCSLARFDSNRNL